MDVSLLSQVSFEEVAHSQSLQFFSVLNIAAFNVFFVHESQGNRIIGRYGEPCITVLSSAAHVCFGVLR